MRLYKPNVTSININGQDYPADNQGVIDLPDHLITSGLFASGWVDARGYLAQLARAEKAASPVAVKAMPETKAEPPLLPQQDTDVPFFPTTTATTKPKKHGNTTL